jgi:hypothetical protein
VLPMSRRGGDRRLHAIVNSSDRADPMDGDHGWAKLTSVVHYNRGKMKTAAAHTLVEPVST